MSHSSSIPPRLNELGQPIGESVPDWQPRPRPSRDKMGGSYVTIEPLDPTRHMASLFEANQQDKTGAMWTYMPYGPFESLEEYRAWMEKAYLSQDPFFHAILDKKTKKPIGVASYLRIEPAMGTIEVGHIAYSPLLQRQRGATEAMYLMMRRAFDELGYRRYEWKCDSLNAPSRQAALRLGFRFEGIFYQHMIYKNRNRDSAWFAILDKEWPALKARFERWLSPSNFDEAGNQRRSLSSF